MPPDAYSCRKLQFKLIGGVRWDDGISQVDILYGVPYNMKYHLLQTNVFERWLKKQPLKSQVIINARLKRLEIDGHWGFINQFDGLVELK